MKSKKLNEAFEYVEDAYLDLTEQEKQRRRPRWIRIAALAACLCLVVGIAAQLPAADQKSADLENAYMAVEETSAATSQTVYGAVFLANYPAVSPYPNESDFIDPKTGVFDDEAFDEVYQPWREDRKTLHNQPKGYADSLEQFFDKSISLFLSGAEGENRLYSPVNVYMALAMLAEVTGGDTRAQILDALGSEDIEALRNQVQQVWKAHYYNDGGTTSILADSVWLREDIPYNDETLQRLAETYYASSFSGEMGSQELNGALQSWLNEQTGGLLEYQASGEKLDAETIIALASTVLFRCKWAEEFSENGTDEGVFHKADGTDVTCDFMHQSGSNHYFWADRFGAIRRNLEDGFSMWLLLPDEGVAAEELLTDSQTMELIRAGWDWENQKYLIVNQSVPKFDVSSQFDLREGLAALGITDVTDFDKADFSPLTDARQEIALTQASHAVRVAIDEEGVTAAAYTVMMAAGAAMPPEEEIDFTLDRPFLFVITSPDNLPMFVGVVNDPA